MDATSGSRMSADGELRYRLRCIDKLGHTFRGDETLLDAGCGNGGVARLLRQRVQEVVAVDVEASAAWQEEPGLTFTVANAEQLPFADASFDLVHSKDSLHHMELPERALAEYRRVLKPDGSALIVEANRYNPIFYPHMTLALGHEHFTRRRFRALVSAVFPAARFGAFEAHYVPRLSARSPCSISLRRRSSASRPPARCCPTTSRSRDRRHRLQRVRGRPGTSTARLPRRAGRSRRHDLPPAHARAGNDHRIIGVRRGCADERAKRAPTAQAPGVVRARSLRAAAPAAGRYVVRVQSARLRARARGARTGRARQVVLWSVDFVPDRFGSGTFPDTDLRPP